jgi:probable addiction module antidote protein
MALVTVFVTVEKSSISIYCSVAVINRHNPKISNAPKRTGKTISGENSMARNVKMTHREHLRDPEVAAEYLSEALEEGDSGVVLMALRNIAEAQEVGIARLAERAHLGRESMYKMLSEAGNPKLSSFTKVIQELGLHLKVQVHT